MAVNPKGKDERTGSRDRVLGRKAGETRSDLELTRSDLELARFDLELTMFPK